MNKIKDTELKNQIHTQGTLVHKKRNAQNLKKQNQNQAKSELSKEVESEINKLKKQVAEKVDKKSMDGEAQKIFRLVKAKIKDTKPNDVETNVVPIKRYLATLLYCEQPPTPIPCQPGRLHYGVARFQNSLQVNANGHAAVMGCFDIMGIFGNLALTSPFLYVNEASYNPAITTNALTGGWNLNMINGNGTNFSNTELS